MKSLIYGISVAFIALGIGYGIHTYYTYNSPRSFVVVLDVTDGHQITVPDVNTLLFQTGVWEDRWSEVNLEFVIADDKEQAPIYTAKLDPAFPLLTDERMRNKQIEDFSAEIQSILIQVLSERTELKYSSIYKRVNQSMERLDLLEGKKTLLIITNGYENHERFSVFDNNQVSSELVQSDVYAKALRAIDPPVINTKIEIIFLMKATNRRESLFFEQIVGGYRLLYPDSQISINSSFEEWSS